MRKKVVFPAVLSAIIGLCGLLFVNADRVSEESGEPAAPVLKIVSWNLKRTTHERYDYDRIASIVAGADIMAFQSFENEDTGKGPLHIIADLAGQRANAKFCRAWFRGPGDNKERFVLLWRESAVALIEPTGEFHDTCVTDKSIVLQASPHKGFNTALFFSKDQKRMFVLTTSLVDDKTRTKDLAPLFRNVVPSRWPAIVVGLIPVPKKGSVTEDLHKMNFKTAFSNSKKTAPNFWFRKAVAVQTTAIDLSERFSEISSDQIEHSMSMNPPIYGEFALMDEPDDAVHTLMLKKVKRETSSVKKARVVETPEATFEEPREDLEREASEADPQVKAKKAKKPKKAKKKKKTPSPT
jgi:hypothetical protein